MFFCCACSSFAVGSDTLMNEYAIEKLTLEEGFVSSEIYSIIQDRKGFLWFGTAENGVMRYDGRNVTLFEYDRSTASGLSHTAIFGWGPGAAAQTSTIRRPASLRGFPMMPHEMTRYRQIVFSRYFMTRVVIFG